MSVFASHPPAGALRTSPCYILLTRRGADHVPAVIEAVMAADWRILTLVRLRRFQERTRPLRQPGKSRGGSMVAHHRLSVLAAVFRRRYKNSAHGSVEPLKSCRPVWAVQHVG